jgi:hypothetical protein
MCDDGDSDIQLSSEAHASWLHNGVWVRCASVSEGGGILVVETVLDEGGRGPLSTLLCSLNMLLQTEGRERTEAQFRALLSSAGFCDIQLRRTGGTYDAILGRKESCHST